MSEKIGRAKVTQREVLGNTKHYNDKSTKVETLGAYHVIMRGLATPRGVADSPVAVSSRCYVGLAASV